VKIIEPGAIATDFGGRSLDFSNDETLTEYQSIVGKIATGMPAFFENASPAAVVADVIYEAATDDTDQLRYTAGEDAKAIIENRRLSDDASLAEGMKKQFGL
jgi:hypothetical protein